MNQCVIRVVLLLICSLGACALFAEGNHLTLTVINKTDLPLAANIFYQSSDPIATHPVPARGFYGYPLRPMRKSTISLPEFYWFAKVAIGGLKRPGSKVRIREVLNHAIANKFALTVPNIGTQSFDLTTVRHTVTITKDKDGKVRASVQ